MICCLCAEPAESGLCERCRCNAAESHRVPTGRVVDLYAEVERVQKQTHLCVRFSDGRGW